MRPCLEFDEFSSYTTEPNRCLNIENDALNPKCLIGLPLGGLGGLRSGMFWPAKLQP